VLAKRIRWGWGEEDGGGYGGEEVEPSKAPSAGANRVVPLSGASSPHGCLHGSAHPKGLLLGCAQALPLAAAP